MELQLNEILRLTLGHYPSTNSCKYTWFFAYWVKKITIKDKIDLKIDKIM